MGKQPIVLNQALNALSAWFRDWTLFANSVQSLKKKKPSGDNVMKLFMKLSQKNFFLHFH